MQKGGPNTPSGHRGWRAEEDRDEQNKAIVGNIGLRLCKPEHYGPIQRYVKLRVLFAVAFSVLIISTLAGGTALCLLGISFWQMFSVSPRCLNTGLEAETTLKYHSTDTDVSLCALSNVCFIQFHMSYFHVSLNLQRPCQIPSIPRCIRACWVQRELQVSFQAVCLFSQVGSSLLQTLCILSIFSLLCCTAHQ